MKTKDGSTLEVQESRIIRAPGFVGTLALVLLIRAAILAIGLISVHVAPADMEPRFNFENPWIAWDARHYHEIALNGYATDRVGRPYRDHGTYPLIAYFPLVPMAGRALSLLLPLSVALVSFSNVCSMIGFGFLYAWSRRLAGPWVAFVCAMLLAVFPGAVAFCAGMTEGPFFMLAAMTLWLLETRRFYVAAAVAGIATLTRPTGVAVAAIVPLYAWTYLKHLPFSRRLGSFLLLGIISVSGLLIYETFLWHRFKSPIAYFDAQNLWKRMDNTRVEEDSSHGVKRYSMEFFRERIFRPQAWNRGLAVLLLFVIIAGFVKPQGIPRVLLLMPLIILLMTCVPDRGLRVSSLPRYESAAAPLFLLAAVWLSSRPRLHLMLGVLIFMLGVQMYYAWLFPREIWVG